MPVICRDAYDPGPLDNAMVYEKVTAALVLWVQVTVIDDVPEVGLMVLYAPNA